MSTFTVTFNTDNAAFRQDDESLDLLAVAAMLQQIADRVADRTPPSQTPAMTEVYVNDLNGNRVGSFIIEED
jgi:hypothetical protein